MTDVDLITEQRLGNVEMALRRAFAARVVACVLGGVLFFVGSLLVVYLLPTGYDRAAIAPLVLLASVTLASSLALGEWRAHRQERQRIKSLRQRLRAGEVLRVQDVKAR